MNIIKKISVNGWLPSGLVLNAGITYHKVWGSGVQISVLPSMPAEDFAEGSIVVEQAGPQKMITLKGRAITPAILANLQDRWASTDPFDEHVHVAYPNLRMSYSVDPFSDPCMLMTPMRFEGDIIIYGGLDVPTVSLTYAVGGGQYHLEPEIVTINTPYATRPTATVSGMLVAIACSLYVPEHAGHSIMGVGVVGDGFSVASHSVAGFSATALDNAGATLYGLTADEANFASAVRQIAIATVAMDHTRHWISSGSPTRSGFAPMAQIVVRDGGVDSTYASMVGVDNVTFVPSLNSQVVLSMTKSLITAAVQMEDLLKGTYQNAPLLCAVPEGAVCHVDEVLQYS